MNPALAQPVQSVSPEEWQTAWSELEVALGAKFSSLRTTCPVTRSCLQNINLICQAAVTRPAEKN